jgi:hypothetical protein
MDKVCLGGYGLMQLVGSIKGISQPLRYYDTITDHGISYRVYGTKFTETINFYAIKV